MRLALSSHGAGCGALRQINRHRLACYHGGRPTDERDFSQASDRRIAGCGARLRTRSHDRRLQRGLRPNPRRFLRRPGRPAYSAGLRGGRRPRATDRFPRTRLPHAPASPLGGSGAPRCRRQRDHAVRRHDQYAGAGSRRRRGMDPAQPRYPGGRRRRPPGDGARAGGGRGAVALDPADGAGRHDHHRRSRPHRIAQHHGRAPVRLLHDRGRGQERQPAHALARPRTARCLSEAVSHHGRTAHHRHRPHRGRPAQGRHDLPHASHRGRAALGRTALFHRLHPRPDRPAAHRKPAEGAAVGSDAHVALHGAGRDGLDARARDQPAADRHQQLPARQPAPARPHRQRADAPAARRAGQGRRPGAACRPHHPPIARVRVPRRKRPSDREPRQADRGRQHARPGRRAGGRHHRVVPARPQGRSGAGRSHPDPAGPGQPDPQRHGES